jgi:hypothetical protein
LTGWTLESALLEYRIFLPPADDWHIELDSRDKEKVGKPKKEKERIADIQVSLALFSIIDRFECFAYTCCLYCLQLIDRFPIERLRYDPEFAPIWLKDQ